MGHPSISLNNQKSFCPKREIFPDGPLQITKKYKSLKNQAKNSRREMSEHPEAEDKP